MTTMVPNASALYAKVAFLHMRDSISGSRFTEFKVHISLPFTGQKRYIDWDLTLIVFIIVMLAKDHAHFLLIPFFLFDSHSYNDLGLLPLHIIAPSFVALLFKHVYH